MPALRKKYGSLLRAKGLTTHSSIAIMALSNVAASPLAEVPIGGYLCFMGFLEDLLRMSLGVKNKSRAELYGRFYCEEAVNCYQNKHLKTPLTEEEVELLFEQNEHLRSILFEALMRIEASYSALLIRLMDEYAENHPQDNPNPDFWYFHSVFSTIRFENLQKGIKAYKLIALQSFGTLVAIHRKTPQRVQKSIARYIQLPKNIYKGWETLDLFHSFVGLRNDVTHNRWLMRETYERKPLGYNPSSQESQLGLYLKWIQHVLNHLDPASANRFESSVFQLKTSLPESILRLYF